jgi:hypothetical protein
LCLLDPGTHAPGCHCAVPAELELMYCCGYHRRLCEPSERRCLSCRRLSFCSDRSEHAANQDLGNSFMRTARTSPAGTEQSVARHVSAGSGSKDIRVPIGDGTNAMLHQSSKSNSCLSPGPISWVAVASHLLFVIRMYVFMCRRDYLLCRNGRHYLVAGHLHMETAHSLSKRG